MPEQGAMVPGTFAWPDEFVEAAAIAVMTPAAREHADAFHGGRPGPGHIADARRVLAALAPLVAAATVAAWTTGRDAVVRSIETRGRSFNLDDVRFLTPAHAPPLEACAEADEIDPSAQSLPLTKGQQIVADFETDMNAEPSDLAAAIDAALAEAVTKQRPDRHGFYVASQASLPERGAMWRSLRTDGVPVIASWIDEDGEGATADFGGVWSRICREVTSAEALILYAEPGDFPLKDALIEVGMALAAGVPVYAVLPGVDLEPRSMRPVGSWLAHPGVQIVGSVHEAAQISSLGRTAEMFAAAMLGGR